MNRTVTAAAGIVLVVITGQLLIAGRGLLVPLIIAIIIWNLLNTLANSVGKLPMVGDKIPQFLRMLVALLVLAFLVKELIDIITNNVNEVINVSSRYQENFMSLLEKIDTKFHIKTKTFMESVVKNLSVQGLLVNIYGVFTTITSSAVLIALYVAFLFVEQQYFRNKINALFPKAGHRELVDSILDHIIHDMQTYMGIKTLLSLMTSIASWMVMKFVGLDFAEFWALLIFFLNFIPNIGAIIATAFPAVLAIVQFETWLPFLSITIGLSVIQFVVGNLLEPKFLSKSLNLSPLVILISLGLWGSIWGILGMFLSVPITVMLMIIFAHFESTRTIAVMLSKDGCIKKSYERLTDI